MRNASATCNFLCRPCDFYFLLGFIWPGIFCSRTTDQRDWCAKSTGCIRIQSMENAIKRFCCACYYFCFIAIPPAYYFMHQLVAELRVSYRSIVVDFCSGRYRCIGNYLLTVSFQAIKAAIANPVKSLRTE